MKSPRQTAFYVQRDRETGIVMLRARDRRPGEKDLTSEEVAPGWIADPDAKGKLIEFEVLNPSRHFPPEVLALTPPEFEE